VKGTVSLFKVQQESPITKEPVVGYFRSKGEAGQDEFLTVINVDRGGHGGRLTESAFYKHALRPHVPFPQSTTYLELVGTVSACARARACVCVRIWWERKVKDEVCGLHSARVGDADISRSNSPVKPFHTTSCPLFISQAL
jgi:hypothetical protein